jgi:hypothetical protein
VCCCLVVANPETPNPRNPEMLVPFFFAIRELLYVECLVMKTVKPRTPKSRNAGLTFSFFAFRKFVYVDVWTPELAKFRTPKSRSAGPTFPFFTFQRFVYVVVWALALAKSRTLNSRSTDHLSQFRELLCVDD